MPFLQLRLVILLCSVTYNTALKADSIPSNYHKIAIVHKIPPAILYGIALAESGKKLKKGVFKPWP